MWARGIRDKETPVLMTSSLLQIRVQALVCLGKLVPNLESWMITEQILPTLPKISSKEPGLLMAILGIYKLSYENSNIGVSKDQLAKSALPFLISTSIENTLNLGQFEQYMTLIKAMMAKVEAEQRSRLQQLSAGQEEQRGVPNFDSVLQPTNSSLPQSLNGLDIGGGSAAPVTKPTGILTLEDKKRMAAERENQTKGEGLTPAAAASKPSLSQLSSAPDFGIFGATQPAKPTNHGRAISPLDSLFGPSPSITNSNTNGGAMDLSDFLPIADAFSKKPVSQPSSGLNFPASMGGSTVPAGNQFISAPMNGLGSLGFAPPPSSSNKAVQRPPATSSLDTLFSFSSQQKPSMDALSGLGAVPVRPVQPPPANKQKDPFADLLG